MNYIFIAIFVAIYLVGIVSTIYQIYKITIIDAKARDIKHPKLMGLLATSGKSSEGLILYLLHRRKYPIKNPKKAFSAGNAGTWLFFHIHGLNSHRSIHRWYKF